MLNIDRYKDRRLRACRARNWERHFRLEPISERMGPSRSHIPAEADAKSDGDDESYKDEYSSDDSDVLEVWRGSVWAVEGGSKRCGKQSCTVYVQFHSVSTRQCHPVWKEMRSLLRK
jgi:hypothetical protein